MERNAAIHTTPGASRASSTRSGPTANGTTTPMMTKNRISVSTSPPVRTASRRSRPISAENAAHARLAHGQGFHPASDRPA